VMDFRLSILDFGLQALANVDLWQSQLSNSESNSRARDEGRCQQSAI
jgi:hypothetical protein